VTLRIRDASISLPEATRGPASLEATLRLDGGALVVESARVNAGSSTLDLSGRLERVLPTTATLAARATRRK
jgi:hypothetical protein